MFFGDSFVWGLDAEADERFTEPEKPRIADSKILAAGVSGYGTDQEYPLLKKLWPQVKPAVVVLIFGTDNDRLDNSRGRRASPRSGVVALAPTSRFLLLQAGTTIALYGSI